MNMFVIVLLSFFAIATSVTSLYLIVVGFRESTRAAIKKRLAMMEASHPGSLKMPGVLRDELLSEIPALNKILYKFSVAEKLASLIEQANVQIKVGQLLLLTFTLGLTGFLVGFLVIKGILMAVCLGFILAVIPYLYIRWRKHKRMIRFEEQFPDTLDTIARSLEAGHSFTAAMNYVGQESGDPVGTLFTTAFEEQSLGLSYNDAIRRMAYRMTSLDLIFFITAVNIQRMTGGNLAEILKSLSHIIRERLKIRRQVRVYTAQGRFSGYVLGALPLFMAFAIFMINPAYVKVLFTEKLGNYLVAVALTLQVLGFFVIRKIIKIKI